jgi:hypothetical protein
MANSCLISNLDMLGKDHLITKVVPNTNSSSDWEAVLWYAFFQMEENIFSKWKII